MSIRSWAPPALLALFTAGCSSDRPAPASAPAEPNAASAPAASEAATAGAGAPSGEAAAALADEPVIDLVDNRYLWHLHDRGLVLALASEGVRKYTREYARPWRAVVEHEGHPGRVLQRRQATLAFPLFDPPADALLRLRVHGLTGGQRVTVRLNGKPLGNASLEPSWQVAELPVAAEDLRRGENELVVHVGKRGTAAGEPSYALWHSIEIAPTGSEAGEAFPALDPVRGHVAGGEARPALTGVPRLVQLVEIPPTAWLELATAAEAEAGFRVTATTVDGDARELLSAEHGGDGWKQHRVSLAELEGELVALELAVTSGDAGAAAWGAPRIALEATSPRARPEPAKNVILLVVDALRSDKLPLYQSVYGDGHAVNAPSFTGEAEKGAVVFLHNQAASPSSPPSHGSIQTGMIPRVHGVDGDKGRIAPGTPTVSTQLEDAGVRTGYFGNNPFGMGRLEGPGRWTEFVQPGQRGLSNDCTALMDLMLGFAKQQSEAGERFFISSLPYETHTPYRYHEGITEKYYDGSYPPPVGKSVDGNLLSALSDGRVTLTEQQWKQLRGLYDGEAEYMDGCFAQLVRGLDDAGLLADTAIVLTSDHGEGLFEHGKMGHAWGHHRELGDVPFVIYWPELADGVVEISTVTSHHDLAPTILDMMGVAPDEAVQGESVLPLALRGGPWTPRVVSLEYGRSYSLRSERYKMIVGYNGEDEYYDLGADPWETEDIRAAKPLAVRYLRDLAGFFLEHRSDWKSATWGALNDHDDAFLQHVGAE